MNKRFARLTTYVLAISVGGSFCAYRSAKAQVAERSLQLGRDLLPLSDVLHDHQRVSINGEHLWASSSLSDVGVRDILDRFESHCRAGGVTGISWGSGAGEGKAKAAQIVDVSEPESPRIPLGVLRSEIGEEGSLLCFPHGKNGAFMDGLSAFTKTHDFGELGQMRYVYVRREKDTSHVLAIWSDEHLDLDKLAGGGRAEPGFDDPDLPRPIDSRRLIATSIDGSPYGALGYMSSAAPYRVLQTYSDGMAARGWTVTRTIDDHVVAFLKGGAMVTVRATTDQDGTLIGIAKLGVDPAMESARE